MLVRVTGKVHTRPGKSGAMETIPVGAIIDVSEREAKAFAGRLVPAAGVPASMVPPPNVPPEGQADQPPPPGSDDDNGDGEA